MRACIHYSDVDHSPCGHKTIADYTYLGSQDHECYFTTSLCEKCVYLYYAIVHLDGIKKRNL
jgi:hypothetical protein